MQTDAQLLANRLLWEGLFLANPQTVSRALSQGADPNARYGGLGLKFGRYDDAESPLHGALNPSPTSQGARIASTSKANVSGVSDIINQLINAGADVAALDHKGRTPLWVMCSAPKLKLSAKTQKLLINKTKDAGMIDAQTAYSRETALHKAAKEGSLSVVETLFQAGADIEARDHESFTPILAAFRGLSMTFLTGKVADLQKHVVTIKGLSDLGADVNARDNDGNSAPEIFSSLHIYHFVHIGFNFSELHPVRRETVADFKIASLDEDLHNATTSISELIQFDAFHSEKPLQGIERIQRTLTSGKMYARHEPILRLALSHLEQMQIERETATHAAPQSNRPRL